MLNLQKLWKEVCIKPMNNLSKDILDKNKSEVVGNVNLSE